VGFGFGVYEIVYIFNVYVFCWLQQPIIPTVNAMFFCCTFFSLSGSISIEYLNRIYSTFFLFVFAWFSFSLICVNLFKITFYLKKHFLKLYKDNNRSKSTIPNAFLTYIILIILYFLLFNLLILLFQKEITKGEQKNLCYQTKRTRL